MSFEVQMAEEFIGKAKNIVFIGEAGSGKTETAVNLALRLARVGGRAVHFFDMDQTKPLFRARDCEVELERHGVTFHFQAQYLDAPTVAPGIAEAHMIGQFSQLLRGGGALVLYIVNPFRPWSGRREDIEVTMRRVLGAARLGEFSLVANPNLGPGTTAEDVTEGLRRFGELFPDEHPRFVCALEELCSELAGRVREPLLPIRLNTVPEWLEGSGMRGE